MMASTATSDLVIELDEEIKSMEKVEQDQATYVFDDFQHMKLLVENLNRMRQNNILIDLKMLNNEGACVEFHSPLLAAASSYFRQHFSDTRIHFHKGSQSLRDSVDTDVLIALQKYLYEPEELFKVRDWEKLMEFSSSFGFFKMVNGKIDIQDYLTNLQDMKDKCQMTYTVLQAADDKQFLCHGCIVAASSPHMCQKLWSEDYPANNGRLRLVLPSEVQSKAMIPLLSYVYRGKITVNWESVDALLTASYVLQYPAVARACVDFIRRRMTASNAISYEKKSREMLKLRKWKVLEELNLMAKEMVSANIEKVVDSASFALCLTEDDILKYLGSSDTTKLTMEALVPALLRWRAAEEGRDRPFSRLVAIACHLLDKDETNRKFAFFQQYYGKLNGGTTINSTNSKPQNTNNSVQQNPTSSTPQTSTALQNPSQSFQRNPSNLGQPGPNANFRCSTNNPLPAQLLGRTPEQNIIAGFRQGDPGDTSNRQQ